MRKSQIGLLVGILLSVTLACAPTGIQETPSERGPAPGVAQPTSKPQEAWELEWERFKAEAKKEGEVVLYGQLGASAQQALRKVLKEKFGIEAIFVALRGEETTNKIIAEQNAGLYLADVIFATTNNIINYLKPQGRIPPMDSAIIFPEILDPKVWWQGRIPWVDNDQRYHIAFLAGPRVDVMVNAAQVKPGEIKSYKDLLAPKWKGKIVINDPTVSGSGNAWFSAMAEFITGPEYLRELVKQEPVILRDQRLQVEWVARGKNPVLIAATEQVEADFIKAGANIDLLVLEEGGYVSQSSGAISLAARASHPNAAKVVINWVLSKEGQTVLSETFLMQSGRVDVPTDFLPRFAVRKPGLKYFNTSTEDFQYKKNKNLQVAKEIFGPLMK